MIRNTLILIVLFVLLGSFARIDKYEDAYDALRKMEQVALKSVVGKVFVRDLTGRDDCNKSRVKYLGIVHTSKGRKYKILTSFFVYNTGSTCHGKSAIKVFDLQDRYVGEYHVGMPEDLPDVLKDNKLLYVRDSDHCNRRKTGSIHLGKGLPKSFFLPCSENGGDVDYFSSGD